MSIADTLADTHDRIREHLEMDWVGSDSLSREVRDRIKNLLAHMDEVRHILNTHGEGRKEAVLKSLGDQGRGVWRVTTTA